MGRVQEKKGVSSSYSEDNMWREVSDHKDFPQLESLFSRIVNLFQQSVYRAPLHHKGGGSNTYMYRLHVRYRLHRGSAPDIHLLTSSYAILARLQRGCRIVDLLGFVV
jgi:hypothetical protein